MRLSHLATVLLFASLTPLIGISKADASLIQTSSFAAGDVLPSVSPNLTNDLLLQPTTYLASVSGDNPAANPYNGTTGTASENSGTNPAQIWGQNTTTYNFDLAQSPAGYEISAISLFSGWVDGRSDQAYTINYSLVGAPATFIQLGSPFSVSENGTGGSLVTQSFDSSGAPILTGVASIQFAQGSPPNGNSFAGTGTVFREFVINGLPIPEPSSFMLCGLGLVGLLVAARSRKG